MNTENWLPRIKALYLKMELFQTSLLL